MEFLIWAWKLTVIPFPCQRVAKKFLTQAAGKEIIWFQSISLMLLRPYSTLIVLIDNLSAPVNLKLLHSHKLSHANCCHALNYTAQKMRFSIKDFFSKCDLIRSILRIRSHLLKKSLMENFIFCAVLFVLFFILK